ncbi:MAG: DNA mismatch repair protein MutS, partial [Flavobacteriales bacterium]|nr:DNA mismatch repair protein MutS [Flavobacteriales bacterium]
MHAPDERTSTDLGFDQIVGMLGRACNQPTARQRASLLAPFHSPGALEEELKRTSEFFRIRYEGISFPAIDFNEIQRELGLLGIRDSVLPQESFGYIAGVVTLVNEIADAVDGLSEAFPLLYAAVHTAGKNNDILPAIFTVFD